MSAITKRQQDILTFLEQKDGAQSGDIRRHIEHIHGAVTRMTIARDLNALTKMKEIIKEGRGRSIRYKLIAANILLRPINVDAYLAQSAEERAPAKISFDRDIVRHLHDFFTEDERHALQALTKTYRQARTELSPALLRRTLEQLMIEFTWKSSHIEGNTYSLIETETLIKSRQQAKNHPQEEAVMILNQKEAFDAILESPKNFRKLRIGTIENLHKIITKDLGIPFGIRHRPVRIGASAYVPLDNPHQIREALEKTVSAINAAKNPFERAFIALLMISYIQPFEDGNKRTARMTANALLAAGNCCPLSWRTVDENDYKKATIVFYECHSARFFKELFVEQCRFAVEEYFPSAQA